MKLKLSFTRAVLSDTGQYRNRGTRLRQGAYGVLNGGAVLTVAGLIADRISCPLFCGVFRVRFETQFEES